MLAAFVLSASMTAWVRRYALARSLVDVPDHRTSHSAPTPRGGGLAVVLVTLSGACVFAALSMTSWRVASSLLGGGALVALIGFVDDHGHVRAGVRLLGHFVAATWVVAWLGGMPSLVPFGGPWEIRLIGWVVAIFYVSWIVNLTNFMDGIDGIAAVETITVGLAMSLIFAVVGIEIGTGSGLLQILLAASTAGFLVWNWPPARIFLGDVGSGFLGVSLAVLSLEAGWLRPDLFWSWLVMLGVFVVDASVTLLRRVLRGETFYEAHRSHGYQHATRRWGSHVRVTVATGAINLFWLLPVATLVALDAIAGPVGLLVGYVPLVLLALHFEAGVKDMASHPPRA